MKIKEPIKGNMIVKGLQLVLFDKMKFLVLCSPWPSPSDQRSQNIHHYIRFFRRVQCKIVLMLSKITKIIDMFGHPLVIGDPRNTMKQ